MSSKDNPVEIKNPQFVQPYPYPSPYAEEDEINLLEYFVTLLKYKWMIILLVFLSGAGTVVYSLQLTNIYRSEATIALRESEKTSSPLGALGGLGGLVASQFGIGGGGSLEKLEVVLNSRELSARVINRYELMHILFSDDWDTDKKIWISEKPPTLQDGLKNIKGLLSVKADLKKSTLSVGFEHKDPETAKKIVDYYLTELSNSLREDVFKDAAENMRFFREQLQQTSDALLREKLYALLAKEIEKETFAKAQKYYSFLVLDPPIIPDLDKKVKPKRSQICILSVVVAFFAAVFLAFFIEFIKKTKAEDPERYAQVADGLKLWRRR